MEQGNFASSLRTTTIERQRFKDIVENQIAQERQQQTEEMVAQYVTEHKEKMIDTLALNAIRAAEEGHNTTSAKLVEPIENREGLYQTAREVRDYFKKEGFKAGMETYENGYIHYHGHGNQEWKEPTECGATIIITWSN